MAIFVDRWHPLRITVYGTVFGVLGSLMSLVWLFVTLPGNIFFWLNVVNVLISAFLGALLGAASLPTEMRVFPQSRFGQFCSSQAMLRSGFTVTFGILAGLFIDLVRWGCGGSDFAYRFIHLWIAVFSLISAVFLVKVYRMWYRMGGDNGFQPPAPWSPSGVEEMPVVPIVGPQSRWLRVAFRLIDGVMALSTLGIPVLMAWMMSSGRMVAFRWYAFAVLPLAITAWWGWRGLKRALERDIVSAQAAGAPRWGIPHHGMMVVLGAKFILVAATFCGQVAVTIVLQMERGAIVFGLANGITNVLLVGMIYLLCRVERGFSTTVDQPGVTAAGVVV